MEFDKTAFFLAVLIGFFILYTFKCDTEIIFKKRVKCQDGMCHLDINREE